jgi:hypothetical protein
VRGRVKPCRGQLSQHDDEQGQTYGQLRTEIVPGNRKREVDSVQRQRVHKENSFVTRVAVQLAEPCCDPEKG